MALYEVSRTDAVLPGEFTSALVIASGTAQARGAVAHMTGVTKKNVRAERVDVTGAGAHTVLSTYFDESEPADAGFDILSEPYSF